MRPGAETRGSSRRALADAAPSRPCCLSPARQRGFPAASSRTHLMAVVPHIGSGIGMRNEVLDAILMALAGACCSPHVRSAGASVVRAQRATEMVVRVTSSIALNDFVHSDCSSVGCSAHQKGSARGASTRFSHAESPFSDAGKKAAYVGGRCVRAETEHRQCASRSR